jgi:hypothetical protein
VQLRSDFLVSATKAVSIGLANGITTLITHETHIALGTWWIALLVGIVVYVTYGASLVFCKCKFWLGNEIICVRGD